jgi:hypothetical protein
MRTTHVECARPRRGTALWAVALALGTVASAGAAEEAPSLAHTISFEKADLWSKTAEPAPLTSAYYTTAAAEAPVLAAASVPCSSCQGGDGGAACSSCGGGGGSYFNRCGCSAAMFPWFEGPGRCDDWCVGPHWEVAADGLIMFREDVNWAAVPLNGFNLDLADQFEHGPGGRVFVTGFNDRQFGLQVGYEGINEFHANALFSNGLDSRAISYESSLNSVEVNFMRRTSSPWRPFGGARYIELDEEFFDTTTAGRVIPPPADPPAGPVAYIDTMNGRSLENRLMGLQAGMFRDTWRFNRWLSIEPFGNAGVYLNDFKRRAYTRTTTTVVNGDDISTPASEYSEVAVTLGSATIQEFSELAFVGEAGITSVLRLSPCVALRGGYQVLAINGIGQGIDAFLVQGLNPDTLVYHGGHFGIEYGR